MKRQTSERSESALSNRQLKRQRFLQRRWDRKMAALPPDVRAAAERIRDGARDQRQALAAQLLPKP